MPKVFEQKKRKILDQLAIPDAQYTDLSPKGSVDEGVRELCDAINAQEGLVTTSSCAGRIAVFLEGGAAEGPGQGKGGGRWLFVSHEPVDVADVPHSDLDGRVWSLLGIAPQHREPAARRPLADDAAARFVHFKFEPMILHILTSSLHEAQRAHSAAMSAGLRESGISGVSGSEPTPLVAVRTQGLAFDSIVAYQDAAGEICPMVSEDYLWTLLRLANQRFHANTERKERFRQALLEDLSSTRTGEQGDWEPADVRRERKRAEGLRRREEQRKEMEAKARDESVVSSTDQVDYSMELSADI